MSDEPMVLVDVVSAIPGVDDHIMVSINGQVYRKSINRDKAADLIKKLADVK